MNSNFIFVIISTACLSLSANNKCDMNHVDFKKKLNQFGQLFSDEYGTDVVSQNQGSAATEILDLKLKCSSVFKEKNVDQCFNNIFGFSKEIQKIYSYTRSGSFDMSEIYKNVNKKSIDLPKEFKNGLPKNWKEIAQEKKWKFLEYRSRTVANPPHNQYSRILFQIEIDGIDQWIQFTVPDPEMPGQPLLIDVIGMEKPDPKLGLDRPRINFAQYARDTSGENPSLVHSTDACYRCHSTGMRQLNPAPGSFETQNGVVDEFNKKMESYDSTDWSKFIDVQKLGPHFGEKQNCTSCHNNFESYEGSPRGAIHYMFNTRHIEHKMLAEVSMSPGSLNSDERKKLNNQE